MAFHTGIENLAIRHKSWLKGRNLALASYAAAVDHKGLHSADLLFDSGFKLRSLFSPEHGFDGTAEPGAKVKSSFHSKYKIPIHSLYGHSRRPSSESLQDIDTLIVDFQSIPARCYTYLATLLNIMQSAEENEVEVIVADRPIPGPNTVDGPPLCTDCQSFVAPAPLPMAYGMTLGEAALWAKRYMKFKTELKVSEMTDYSREDHPLNTWPSWINPSPAITSWESALCYLSTVSCEALPVLDVYRGRQLSFQAFRTPFLDSAAVSAALTKRRLPGIIFHPVPENNTVIMELSSPLRFKPVLTGAAILLTIADIHGSPQLWKCKGARPAFFDKLFGGAHTRESLQAGVSLKCLADDWRGAHSTFRRQRRSVMLYSKEGSK